jgi:hypothetical protein
MCLPLIVVIKYNWLTSSAHCKLDDDDDDDRLAVGDPGLSVSPLSSVISSSSWRSVNFDRRNDDDDVPSSSFSSENILTILKGLLLVLLRLRFIVQIILLLLEINFRLPFVVGIMRC